MNTRCKIALKIVVFIVIVAAISFVITPIFIPKFVTGRNRTSATIVHFYKEPKNTIDVVYLGASLVVHGVSPLLIWEEYGIASYSLASGAQPPRVTLYLLDEAIAHQNPEVIVLDTSAFFWNVDYNNRQDYVRGVLDYTPLSKRKLRMMNEIASSSERITFFSLLYPLDAYHDRWESLGADDFMCVSSQKSYKGESASYEVVAMNVESNYLFLNNEGDVKLDEMGAHYLERIILACEQNSIVLLLTAMPRQEWSYEKSEIFVNLASKHDIAFIDYNLPEMREKIGIDFISDYYDKKHLNVWGATKVSRHLGAFLQEEFGVADKRNDPRYAKWFHVLALYNKEKQENSID